MLYNRINLEVKLRRNIISTKDNLKSAFAGESQANRRYLAFAKKVEAEGYKATARMFKAATEAETFHTHAHLDAMDGINSTADNLKEAVSGETFKFKEMYPPYLEEAKEAGHNKAIRSFTLAMKTEKVYTDLFQDALNNLSKDDNSIYYLCPTYGYVKKNSIPDACPIE